MWGFTNYDLVHVRVRYCGDQYQAFWGRTDLGAIRGRFDSSIVPWSAEELKRSDGRFSSTGGLRSGKLYGEVGVQELGGYTVTDAQTVFTGRNTEVAGLRYQDVFEMYYEYDMFVQYWCYDSLPKHLTICWF